MRRVLEWCEARGIEVETHSAPSEYEIASRTIRVQRGSAEAMLISLLHECGHALCDRSRAKLWPNGYANLAASGSLQHDIECLAEEIEAWRRGERLAKRLGVRLNLRRYRRARNAALATYARAC